MPRLPLRWVTLGRLNPAAARGNVVEEVEEEEDEDAAVEKEEEEEELKNALELAPFFAAASASWSCCRFSNTLRRRW